MASPTHPHLVTLNSRAQTTSQTSQKMYFLPSQYSGPDEYLRSQLSTVQSELENEQAARLETEAARLETEAVLSEESLRVRKCIAAYQLLWVAFEQMEIERNRYETQLQDLSIKYQTLAGAISNSPSKHQLSPIKPLLRKLENWKNRANVGRSRGENDYEINSAPDRSRVKSSKRQAIDFSTEY